MTDYLSATISPPLNGGLDRSASSRESLSLRLTDSPTCESTEPTRNRPYSPILTLNDDVLLIIFYIYRVDVADDGDLLYDWDRERWWYKLAQVCRRWRYLILASPSRLNLHLLCTYGVPVADMLAHSPPLPLAIFYHRYHKMTADDEGGVLFALSHRDRVRDIRLDLPASTLRKFVTTMDKQFPILARMYVECRPDDFPRTWQDESTIPVFPGTFQAPNLRHLVLSTASLPIELPLLTTTAGLVILKLVDIPASAYFPPSHLLTGLSIMLQLEELIIHFCSSLPNSDLQRELLQTPNMTRVTLPNLHQFGFQGTSAYFKGLVARISTPVLSILRVELFNQRTFTVPQLLQFMGISEILNREDVRLNQYGDNIVWRCDYLDRILQVRGKLGE
jgi:hypothetical protein